MMRQSILIGSIAGLVILIHGSLGPVSTRAFAQSAAAPAPDGEVATVTPTELTKLVVAERNVMLFDVRDPAEFTVSHLKGAKLLAVAANEDRDKFFAVLGRKANGATVVFYCTLGARSGDFAQSVQHDLLARGAKGVYVLKGGIFAWHDEGRELVDRKGKTPFVHPYNDEMKQQLKRPAYARVEPRR